MNLTEVIKKSTTIEEGKMSFFIAEKDIEFHGLHILKDSLVFADGKNVVRVNKIRFGIFQDSNYPKLILQKLEDNDRYEYIVEKVSLCNKEITHLNSGWLGIWHNNHFDKWRGNYSDYLERINNLPKLNLKNIEFSSIMYVFDIQKQSLVHFINTKPITINVNNFNIHLPELLEVSFSNNHYTIIAIKDSIDYNNIKLQKYLSINESGVLSGDSAEDFEAKIEGHSKFRKLTITKGSSIQVSHNGITTIAFLNEENNRIETYRIYKI